MVSRHAHIICTTMTLIYSDKWAGFPVRYWLRNGSVFSSWKLVLPQNQKTAGPKIA